MLSQKGKTTSSPSRPPKLRLGHEELALVLWLLKAPSVLGMGSDMFGHLSEAEILVALASADHSLRAKGLLRVDDHAKKVKLSQLALVLVGACALSQLTLSLTHERGEQDKTVCLIHYRHPVFVQHSNPELGVHEFEELRSREAVLRRVRKILDLHSQPEAPGKVARLRSSDWQQASELATQGKASEVSEMLTRAGLDDLSARVISHGLAALESKSIVTLQPGNEIHDLQPETLLFFEGGGGMWRLQEESDGGVVVCEPSSASAIARSLNQTIERACEGVIRLR